MGKIAPLAGGAWIAGGLVLVAATFNLGLCFLNTHFVTISVTYVIAGEVVIIGAAAALSSPIVTPQIFTLGVVLLAYFCGLWLVTGALDPKAVRDFLIPLVFVLCGAACVDARDADRLVYALVVLVFTVAAVAGLIGFAAVFRFHEVDQSLAGRLAGSGRLIAGFDLKEWLGISHRLPQSVLDNLDSRYAYAIYAFGLPGLILLWTLFSFTRDRTVDGARYRGLLAVYFSLAFSVGERVFSIKTAALAWFLLGASQNRTAVARDDARLRISLASARQATAAR